MAVIDHAAHLAPLIAGAWRLADWQWTPQQRLAWVEANLDIGVTSFDHADLHGDNGAERLLGEALALRPGLRQRLQLIGTCTLDARPQAAPLAAQVQASVVRTLRTLGTEYLDLLLLHRPDPALDPDALANALGAECRAGRVRCIGLGQATPASVDCLHQRLPLAAHQITLSPLQPGALHDGTLDQCQRLGLRPLAWAPLAGGRIFTGQDTTARRLRALLQAIAGERGLSVTTLVIAWVQHHPSQPLPILGSRRITVAQDALAAQALQLDTATWQRIAAVSGNNAGGDAGLA